MSPVKFKTLVSYCLTRVLNFYLRRKRDSNPRNLSVQQFSRLPQSTTLPFLRRKSNANFVFPNFCLLGFGKLLRSNHFFCLAGLMV